MKLSAFLADRWGYMFLYVLNTGLMVLVVDLDFLELGVSLRTGNIIYIFVLSFALLALFLTIDYLRQRPYYRRMLAISQEHESIEQILNLQDGATREQRAMEQLVLDNYGQYASRLAAYREQQEQHHHFTNQWVHQMKTPVSVIHLLIQQAEEMQRLNMRQSSERDERSSKREQAATLHTQEMRELLDSLHEETQRIENALEMMLHTARLEKFELDLTSQRVDLMQLAREVVNEHKKVWIRSSIFPKIITDGSSMVVKTDEKWLRFVLNQLLSNAIKYTRANQGRGARKLLITLEKEGHGCRLCIADEGIGIPEQDLPRVFDPFFTGENGRLVAEATGMGLYLIQQVCARLGHRITVESRQGEGTAVTIRFDNHSLIHDSMHREM